MGLRVLCECNRFQYIPAESVRQYSPGVIFGTSPRVQPLTHMRQTVAQSAAPGTGLYSIIQRYGPFASPID
jgi:hypothetical protein